MEKRTCLNCKNDIILGSSFIFIKNRFDRKFYLCSECVDMVKSDLLNLERSPMLKVFGGKEMVEKLKMVLEVLC